MKIFKINLNSLCSASNACKNDNVHIEYFAENDRVRKALNELYNAESTLQNYANHNNITITINKASSIEQEDAIPTLQKFLNKSILIRVKNKQNGISHATILDTTKESYPSTISKTVETKNGKRKVNYQYDDNLLRAVFRWVERLTEIVKN